MKCRHLYTRRQTGRAGGGLLEVEDEGIAQKSGKNGHAVESWLRMKSR